MQQQIRYPALMVDAARAAWQAGAKIVLVSDLTIPEGGSNVLPFGFEWCVNCGGMGIFVLFIADEGPYPSPSAGREKISHWHDGWYVGKSRTFSCPVCNGRSHVKKSLRQAEFA